MPRLRSPVRTWFPAPYLVWFQHVRSQHSAEWQSGYAPDCKSVYLGSTPGSASRCSYDCPALIPRCRHMPETRHSFSVSCTICSTVRYFGLHSRATGFTKPLRCPGGEIGRRKRLKVSRPYGRAGSSPAPGTIEDYCVTASQDRNRRCICAIPFAKGIIT